MDDRIRLATEKLKTEGHSIERIRLGDKPYYRIDGDSAITGKEMRELADGVYTFAELKGDLLIRRRAEERR